jgi:hypothetical protein
MMSLEVDLLFAAAQSDNVASSTLPDHMPPQGLTAAA